MALKAYFGGPLCISGYIRAGGGSLRGELGKRVRNEFSRMLKEKLPLFIEEKNAEIYPGSRLYSWKASSSLYCYIYLVFAQLEDRFVVEIAWSRNLRFPAGALPSDPYGPPHNGDKRFRLSELWGETKDLWWWVGQKTNWEAVIREGITSSDPPVEECIPRIVPAVSDAIQHIVNDAMPYFKRIIGAYSDSPYPD